MAVLLVLKLPVSFFGGTARRGRGVIRIMNRCGQMIEKSFSELPDVRSRAAHRFSQTKRSDNALPLASVPFVAWVILLPFFEITIRVVA